MIESEVIVESLLESNDDDESISGLLAGSLGHRPFQHLKPLSEADEDEDTIKDILGIDYLEGPQTLEPAEGSIERVDRWADMQIGDNHFCISYLTPVAVYLSGEGIKLTDRYWSNATRRHIVKWANHIGAGGYRRYAELADRCGEIPQSDLIELFKQQATRVQWSKRQAKKLKKLPYRKILFFKGGDQDRVSIEPHEK